MRVLVQRVTSARVRVEGQVVGRIGHGLLLLVGAHAEDDEQGLEFCADKCVQLRIFPDDEGKMNRSLLDIGGAILAVSQFTLYGDCRRGRRPSFIAAAPPPRALQLYGRFVELLRQHTPAVEEGVFGAQMEVELTNDGPVPLMIESPER